MFAEASYIFEILIIIVKLDTLSWSCLIYKQKYSGFFFKVVNNIGSFYKKNFNIFSVNGLLFPDLLMKFIIITTAIKFTISYCILLVLL